MARRIRELTAGYTKRLTLADDPIVRTDVARLAEHEVLAGDLGAAALRREPIDYAVLNQHERTVRRPRIDLGLDKPMPAPPPPTIAGSIMSLDRFAELKAEIAKQYNLEPDSQRAKMLAGLF